MRQDLAEYLDDQVVAGGLRIFSEEDSHVREGILQAKDGAWYPITEGVPCFLRGALQPDVRDFARRYHLPPPRGKDETEHEQEQAKTTATFSDKWRRFREYGLLPEHQAFLQRWYCAKLGLPDIEALRAFYGQKRRILEVGPGSGFNTRFMAENCPGKVFAADVSDAAFTTFGNTRHLQNCHVVQADLMDLPFHDDFFDFIIADGVLHHTPDTRRAVEALYRKLQPGGQFFFYVYRKGGAARQFCDAHIREAFTRLSPDECYAACEPLTELGRELSRLHAKITLTKPIPILGIPAGTHDVQRLLYYNFVKCFWNDAFDYETNNMVNFDWYHPHNAWQHTEDEVATWIEDIGAKDYVFNPANPNGISVLLTKAA
jgi:SAM-dependent methyltransferase